VLSSVWIFIQSIFSSPGTASKSNPPFRSGSAYYHGPLLNATTALGMRDVEALEAGCDYDHWQLESHPTCNELHGIDFGGVLLEWKRSRLQQQRYRSGPRAGHRPMQERSESPVMPESQNASIHPSPIGYLSDTGLWRTVWAVPDSDRVSESSGKLPGDPLVLKLMKQEHDVDKRNLDRHRREAVAMERLTSSPHVANIFGFCGTTVLMEFLGETLRDILQSEEVHPSHSRKRSLSRSTPRGRLQLALHAARGIDALHDNSIVHADLQDQQFLLARAAYPLGRQEPMTRLVLNDFNRCRFLTYRPSGNGTRTRCSFRIPSAPGSSRAPEEYAFEELTEQIDVYSLGNVFHQILTGDDPWEGWSVLEISNQVQKGVKPLASPELLEHPSDVLLQNLTLRAYELDPAVRIRAKEIVERLEWAMKNYFGGE
jgi:serine/threonine protein kinase